MLLVVCLVTYDICMHICMHNEFAYTCPNDTQQCMCVCKYIYVCVCTYTHTCIHIPIHTQHIQQLFAMHGMRDGILLHLPGNVLLGPAAWSRGPLQEVITSTQLLICDGHFAEECKRLR